MYVVRAEVTVPVGGYAEAIAWAQEYKDFLKKDKCFIGVETFNSLGNPEKYSALYYWTRREDATARRNSPETKAFFQANPFSGLMIVTGLTQAYEIIYDSGSSGQASYGSMSDIAIKPGLENATTFIDSHKQLFELRQQLEPLVVAQRLFRHMGETRKYLVLTLLADLPEPDAIPPEVQEFNHAHSAGANATTSRIIERCEVVPLA
jgi:hypothetical protein